MVPYIFSLNAAQLYCIWPSETCPKTCYLGEYQQGGSPSNNKQKKAQPIQVIYLRKCVAAKMDFEH